MKTLAGVAKKRESTIQGKFLTWVRSKPMKGRCYVVKVPGGIYAENGTTDTILCVGGLFLVIEFKIPGEEPTRIQEYRMKQVRRSGGISERCDTLEGAKEVVMRVLEDAFVGFWGGKS